MRELREELGVVVTVSRALPSIVHRDPDLTVELFPFLCRIDDAHSIAQIRPHANSELRWVRPAELPHYHFPHANAPLLRQLQSILAPDG